MDGITLSSLPQKSSIMCDKTCMDYLKAELGTLDSDCDDAYSFNDCLEVYCRKCRNYSITLGDMPDMEIN